MMKGEIYFLLDINRLITKSSLTEKHGLNFYKLQKA